jgi:phosphotransferase family enzyme
VSDLPAAPTYERERGTAVWSSAGWRARAEHWLDLQLAAAGIQRTGEIEQPHVRPWATVLRAPTRQGVIWMKAAAAGTAFEVALYELLGRVTPERVLTPIAIDVERGWVVLPDGGPTLAAQRQGPELVPALCAILPQYAELQRKLSPCVGDLLAIGVTDMRAAIMPQRFEDAVAVVERRLAPADRGLFERVLAQRGTYQRWCAELAGAVGAPSLDHNDLHPSNIFFSDAVEVRARFYDWGDSVVAHPFATLLVTLGLLQRELRVGPQHAQLSRVRDAYLEAYGDIAPHATLVEHAELACRVGKVARALIWHRALSTLGPGEAKDLEGAPLRWLGSLLDESHLGNGG